MKQFIDDGDADKANEALDYQTVENAIESLLPGKEWGDYFKSHFKPFLNVRLKTLEQKQALQNILEYCDETTLKVINELPVENYLCRVVPSEMPSGYEIEALKAQAVCARSYAYRQMAEYGYAFQFNMTEDDLTELMMSMSGTQSASYDNNLQQLGYADFSHPSSISIYPKDFDNKEKVVEVLDHYNQQMEDEG